MRIYFDEQRGVIVVAKAKMSFVPGSLSVTFVGDNITIWQPDLETKVVSKLGYQKIKRQNGSGFLSVQECVAYLNEEFSKSVDDNAPDFLASAMEILQ